jgi:hypothetical protein
MKKQIILAAGIAMAVAVFAGCSATNTDLDYKGFQAKDGNAISYVHTTKSALNFTTAYPMIGDATLRSTFEDFKGEAKRLNGSKVRITTSTKTYNCQYFPLIGILFPICTTEIGGEVYP